MCRFFRFWHFVALPRNFLPFIKNPDSSISFLSLCGLLWKLSEESNERRRRKSNRNVFPGYFFLCLYFIQWHYNQVETLLSQSTTITTSLGTRFSHTTLPSPSLTFFCQIWDLLSIFIKILPSNLRVNFYADLHVIFQKRLMRRGWEKAFHYVSHLYTYWTPVFRRKIVV